MTLTQTYEATRDLLTGMAYHRGSTLVAQREYTYDILGRPTARNTARNGQIVNDTFAHNTHSELTAATVNGTDYEYAYDNIGNRKQATEGNDVTVYDANALNQYTAISENGAAAFVPQFDADGNQTLIKTDTGIWSAVYNAENRPVTFTNSDSNTVVECAYDSMGRRAYKKVTTNGGVTLHQRYIYRGYMQIACIDLTRTHHPALWFITWDPSQTVATRPLAIQINGTWYTYGWDLTKNICELYSTSGFISDSYTYTPFGSVTSTNGITQPILWSSEIFDTELGLACYNYRYYNPSSGKWINRDLLQEYVSLNRYLLVNNSPIRNCDYLGLSEIPNCNQQNRGEKHYFCSKLGISNASSNFRFNNLIDNLQDLLNDIEWLEHGLDVGSFATARSAKDIIDAVAEMIITKAAENEADDEWILQKLQEISNYYKNISGASIDVEITVSQCKCRDTWELILSLGIMDRYYWDEIDKKIYSFVVSHTNGIEERKDRAGYAFTQIKRPEEITEQEIDTAIMSAILLAKR